MTSPELNRNSEEDFTSIPVIDISNNNQTELAQQLWDAARNVGFFTIINHSIPPSQIDNLFHLSTQFFKLDPNVKHQYPFNVEKNSGYEYMTQKPPTTGVVDLKETFQVTAREGCMDNLWPTTDDNNEGKEEKEGDHQELASFQNVTMDFINNTHTLACRILSLLESKACPHVAPGTLANSHQLWGKDGQCTLRLLHYPPTTTTPSSNDAENDDTSETTRWRCGAHTDWGSLTLLFQRMGEDGLECQRRTIDDNSESWVEVPPIEGGITVNIGDMLMRWSDKRLYSNSHRVRMPKSTSATEEATAPSKSRYSIAFFLQADKSALIENTTNEPITAGEYFAERINAHFADE